MQSPNRAAIHGEDEPVNLSELKAFAKQFPLGSSTRQLILSEPDSLPRTLALAKMEVFARLLHAELGR